MALNYTKLTRFDLLHDLDENFVKDKTAITGFIEFLNVYQKIQNADQFIKDLPSYPYSTKKITRTEMMSAIGSTLAIEGISLREDEISDVLQERDVEQNTLQKELEVINSRNVYAYIRKEVESCEGEFIYTIEHICTIHRLFTENIYYPNNQPGRFRQCGTTFGDPRKPSLCDNYDSVYQAIKYFVEWLNDSGHGIWSANIFAKALMAHYYLTEIHPFGDGNGRVARALEAMVLYVNKINNYCFWSLANLWSARRNEYISHLDNIRNSCDPFNFILWGAKGYLEEVERIKSLVLKKVKQLMFNDYVTYLFDTNKNRPVKERINKRILGVLHLLSHIGRIPVEKFRNNPAFQALYSHSSSPTPNRDQLKMTNLNLIQITTINSGQFIEPNYEIFNKLEYRV